MLNWANSVFCKLQKQNWNNTFPPFFIFFFKNPADAASLYMLGCGDVMLYEVKAFEDDFHSWFVGQAVQRGGSHSRVNWISLIIITHTAMMSVHFILNLHQLYLSDGKSFAIRAYSSLVEVHRSQMIYSEAPFTLDINTDKWIQHTAYL